jgi:putative sterol carrier protein
MSIPFPSDAWVKALKDVVNSDADYAQAAQNWEADVIFHVEPDSLLPKPMLMYVDLWHGQCRDAYEVASLDDKKAAFVLAAPASVLIRIIQGKLDPMQAMITRQLKVHGSMVYMMKNVPTVLKFVKCASKVDSEFPVAQ